MKSHGRLKSVRQTAGLNQCMQVGKHEEASLCNSGEKERMCLRAILV